MPWRFRVPLLGEVDPPGPLRNNRLEGQPRGAAELFGKLAANRVDDVDLAALQRGEPGCLLRNHLEHQTFDARVLRQYWSKASNTNSAPGVNDTNLYGPAPTGSFLNPSTPTFST